MKHRSTLWIAAVLVLLATGVGLRLYLAHAEEEAAREELLDRIESAFLVEDDPEAAAADIAEGIERFPDEGRFWWWRARAYLARGRFSDALEALAEAERRLEGRIDAEEAEALRFDRTRARTLRFLDTGDRGDFNLVEEDLETWTSSVRFGPRASLLLGLALERRGRNGDRARALDLLRRALRASPDLDPKDVERARSALSRLSGA